MITIHAAKMILRETSIIVPIPCDETNAAAIRVQRWVRHLTERRRLVEQICDFNKRSRILILLVKRIQQAYRGYLAKRDEKRIRSCVKIQSFMRGAVVRRRIQSEAFRDILSQVREARELLVIGEAQLLLDNELSDLKPDLYLELDHLQARARDFMNTARVDTSVRTGIVWKVCWKWPALTLADFKRFVHEDDIGYRDA